jgi:hypothetical protein
MSQRHFHSGATFHGRGHLEMAASFKAAESDCRGFAVRKLRMTSQAMSIDSEL